LEYQKKEIKRYSRFEKARIIGARSLQLSMGAPPLIEVPFDVFDAIAIAKLEYDEDVIPITVKKIRSIGDMQ